MSDKFNAVTAQGRTNPGHNTRNSIQNCNIRAAEDLGSAKTYVGRPWKEYSRTVYMKTFMDISIDRAGWQEWSVNFAWNTSYYTEFDNSGSGKSEVWTRTTFVVSLWIRSCVVPISMLEYLSGWKIKETR
ncbi:hypothetical protein L2E82_18311 [Cichorium intybus]|uniref:Uncharacterized protein n=1 Tax=Cichorium intybus TaxID=13427 RepID=A0ACB9F9R2_CICIN|nr:hypothetical protein L2E82_18311 [Cichorium intybus]